MRGSWQRFYMNGIVLLIFELAARTRAASGQQRDPR
jgi:hypothetical protein